MASGEYLYRSMVIAMLLTEHYVHTISAVVSADFPAKNVIVAVTITVCFAGVLLADHCYQPRSGVVVVLMPACTNMSVCRSVIR